MEVSNLIRVEYHGEAVLSTKQIADAYECSPGNIRWNFAKNADKFVEGVHYFKLEGAALKNMFQKFGRNSAAQTEWKISNRLKLTRRENPVRLNFRSAKLRRQ